MSSATQCWSRYTGSSNKTSCVSQQRRENKALLSGYFPKKTTSDLIRLQTCFSAFILADSSCASTISRSAVIWTLSLSASSNSSIRSSFLRRLSWKMMGDQVKMTWLELQPFNQPSFTPTKTCFSLPRCNCRQIIFTQRKDEAMQE